MKKWLAGTGRWFKYRYIKLLRAKGGPSKVARGFSVGIAVEMFTLPTFGLAAVLIIPLVYLLRASLPGALIGFVFGKIIYIPMAFLNRMVGDAVVPEAWHRAITHLPAWLGNIVSPALDLVIGGMAVGAILGLIMYFPVWLLLEWYTARRKERRRKKAASKLLQME
ncbi:DUF2062 domain-containing protein [Gorillibacterium sp. sgz5001074]|uniref:DUF2062 domain-containing protein n=1 Tax=Gorillibacterium sp. sgz5001074 TaxID=3446695 RepID=UPI003F67EB35